MPVIQPSAAAYARMLKALLPPGRLWRLDPDSKLSKLMLACGDELARVSGRVSDLVEEADPRTTDELLPDFERVLDLDSTGTTAERRARVVAHLVRRQGIRPADFQQALSSIFDLDAADVDIIERGSLFAAAVRDQREIFRFFAYRDPSLAGSYSIDDAQDLIDEMAPVHTVGHAIESIAFKCGEATSLCGRDIMDGTESTGYEFRKTAVAAFEDAVGERPSLLFLGKREDVMRTSMLDARGAAAYSTTAVTGAFGTDAYDFDGSGGAVFECREQDLGGIPADESRAYFVILRARTLPGNAVFGKQDGTSEGFNFFFQLGVGYRLTTVTDSTVLSSMDLTATSSITNDWLCLCAIYDRTNAQVRFASDLEAASSIALPAERINPPNDPLRIGDSRTPPSSLASPDAEIALVAEVQDGVSEINAQTAAAALLAAFVGS